MDAAKKRGARDLTWLVVVFFTLIWIAFVHSRAYSTNETSRLASIESLVHRGTWAIDESVFSHTLDKIRVGDQFYSSKPPTLSFLGAGIYAALHRGLDQTLEWRECVPDKTPSHCRAILEPEEANWPYVILVLLLVSLPATICLALIYRMGFKSGMPNWASLSFVLIMGLGTALFPYGTVFTNHALSAAGILVATYILLTNPEPTKWQLAGAGFAATLAATVDLSAGIYLIGLFIFVLVSFRRSAVYFILGGLGPGLLAIALNLAITGTPLPPQLNTKGYDYPGSAFLQNPGGNHASEDIPAYAFHLLVGNRGLFSFFPIALWLVYGLFMSLRATDLNRRSLARVIGLSTIGYLLYFALRTHNYGGFTFGTRWLSNPVPVMALFAIDPALFRSRPWFKAAVVGFLGLISIAGTYRGALNPWGPAHPLIRLTYEAPEPRQFIPAAISGYESYEEIDGTIRNSFGANTVVRRWFDARSGFVIPDGESWWFVNETTPIANEFAEPLGVNLVTPVSLNADMSEAAAAWLLSFDRSAYQSSRLTPDASEGLLETTLPASFEQDGDSLSLLGYQISQEANELTLITGWQVDKRTFPTGERRIFAHLLAADGTLVAQDDRFSASYDTLFPGDMFFQIQKLSLAELAPGVYWLQIGVYDPDSGARLEASGSDRLLLGQIIPGADEKRDEP